MESLTGKYWFYMTVGKQQTQRRSLLEWFDSFVSRTENWDIQGSTQGRPGSWFFVPWLFRVMAYFVFPMRQENIKCGVSRWLSELWTDSESMSENLHSRGLKATHCGHPSSPGSHTHSVSWVQQSCINSPHSLFLALCFQFFLTLLSTIWFALVIMR